MFSVNVAFCWVIGCLTTLTDGTFDSAYMRNLFQSVCICSLGLSFSLLDRQVWLMLIVFIAELNLAKQSVAKHSEQIENLNKVLLEKGEEVTSLKRKLEEGGHILHCCLLAVYFSLLLLCLSVSFFLFIFRFLSPCLLISVLCLACV